MSEGASQIFKNKSSLFLIAILLLATFFRFFLLGSIPPGLYPDVAMNGMDAIHANEAGDYKIFYPANNGREGLFINLDAFVFKIFGTGLWQIRFAGALTGVLTVLGIYFLGKELAGRNAGLFASFFAATSFWAVNFSRIGFRAVMVPLILVWGSYFLFRAFKVSQGSEPWQVKSGYFYYILSGLIFGLGFHTYIAYKAVILLFPIIFGYKIFFEKGYFKNNLLKIGTFGIVLALVAFPIFYYQQTHKDEAARTGQVSVFNPAVNKGNLIKTLAITTSEGLGMYNFYGDPNARHNFKSLPVLNPLVGIAFLVGIYLSFKNLIAGFYGKLLTVIPAKPVLDSDRGAGIQKAKSEWIPDPSMWAGKQVRNDIIGDEQFFRFLFLIFSFFVMMLPSILTEEGMPHSLRAIGTLPFAFLFAGLGADKGRTFVSSYLKKYNRENYKGPSFVMPILIGIIILFDFVLYFQVWAKDRETRGQFNESYVEASRYLNTLPKSISKYVIVNVGGVEVEGLPVAAQTFKFMTYDKSDVTYVSDEEVKNFKANFEKDSVVILAKHDDKLIDALDLNCPNGSFLKYNAGDPNEFYVYKIPKTAASCGGKFD